MAVAVAIPRVGQPSKSEKERIDRSVVPQAVYNGPAQQLTVVRWAPASQAAARYQCITHPALLCSHCCYPMSTHANNKLSCQGVGMTAGLEHIPVKPDSAGSSVTLRYTVFLPESDEAMKCVSSNMNAVQRSQHHDCLFVEDCSDPGSAADAACLSGVEST